MRTCILRNGWRARPEEANADASATRRMRLRLCLLLVIACFAVAAAPGIASAESAADTDPKKYQRACDAYNRGDFFTAFEDLMPFAVRGDAQSQFAIAEMLRSGNGTKRNRAEALIWYRRAAEQGHGAAQCNLGTSLYNGWGTAADPQGAIDWWLHAAVGGNARAMFNLGTVVAKGRYVQRDFPRAYRWMMEAQALGYAPAGDTMETLKKIMTPSQVEAAIRLTLDDAMKFTRRQARSPRRN